MGFGYGTRCQRDPSRAASPPGAQMTSVFAGGPFGSTMWFTISGGFDVPKHPLPQDVALPVYNMFEGPLEYVEDLGHTMRMAA